MIYGRIYRAEFPNGKMYVGATTLALKVRADCHASSAVTNNPRGCPVFHAAIRKYGNPRFIEIDTGCSKEELSLKEKQWIKDLDTHVPKGYNLAEGGHNGTASEETKRKMSISRTGAKNPRYGKPRSDDVKRKISQTKLGTTLRNEHIANIRRSCRASGHRRNMSLLKSRLSLEEMETVQELYATKEYTQQALADMFYVGRISIRTALLFDMNKSVGV